MLIQKIVAGVPDVFTGAGKNPRCHELTTATGILGAPPKTVPWFVLSDVCKVLEVSQPHRVASRLNKEDCAAATSGFRGSPFMATR